MPESYVAPMLEDIELEFECSFLNSVSGGNSSSRGAGIDDMGWEEED